MTTKKVQAFRMRLEGSSYSRIAAVVGWSEHTLRHYFSPKGRWYLEYRSWSGKELGEIHEAMRTMFIANALEASKTLARLMHSPHPRVVLKACQEILDRAGYRKNSNGWTLAASATDIAEEMMQWFENQNYEKANNTREMQ